MKNSIGAADPINKGSTFAAPVMVIRTESFRGSTVNFGFSPAKTIGASRAIRTLKIFIGIKGFS
jgi:hypothetical protein